MPPPCSAWRGTCSGGIGISISTALVTEHQQSRQARLVPHLSPTNQPYQVLLQQVKQAYVNAGDTPQHAQLAAPGRVFQLLRGQAAVLSYSDVFLITALITLVITVAALAMSNMRAESSGEVGG